jgi:hypothetical protein
LNVYADKLATQSINVRKKNLDVLQYVDHAAIYMDGKLSTVKYLKIVVRSNLLMDLREYIVESKNGTSI